MGSEEIRKRFLDFFSARGHTVVPSSSLIPDDPSVLLTTAGMQQFKAYYTGEADPLATIHPTLGKPLGSKNAASIQKSFRTSDIDAVGDESHLTFFEMLGNFSFGGYFKKEAVTWAHEFITKEMGLPIAYVTIFRGSAEVPKDEESRAVWNSLRVSDVREEGIEDVFWGPTGSSGPCGPTTEIYCKNAEGQDVEVWNLVFNEYFYPGSREELLAGAPAKRLERLKTPGVDTGMGLERLAMMLQGRRDIFETDLFAPVMSLLPGALPIRTKRIIADHIRAIAFLLADGLRPSNRETGYVLRRLMRRVLVYERLHGLVPHLFDSLLHEVIHSYGDAYPELLGEGEMVRKEFVAEREKFVKTIERGIRELERAQTVDAQTAFQLYETYGLPYEVIKELGQDRASALNREAFDAEFERHQEISRAGGERKFGGHGLLLNTGELKARDEAELIKVTRLHTATHLLNAALHRILGDRVEQRGSDITVERTRFDFLFPRKLSPEEIKLIEELVNDAIRKDLPVMVAEMDTEDAKRSGAFYFYRGNYPARVKVYTVGAGAEVFSRELCGGPHVGRTGQIGRFKIVKEESSSAGIRRIRATIEA